MPRVLPGWWSLVLLAAASGAFAADSHPAPYIDLTRHFARFHDETAGVEKAARIARFRKQMDALLPGFYTPRFGATEAQYDARVARALDEFTELRPKFEEVQRSFPAAFDAGIQHFRKQFPDFTAPVPVYLLHSLGEMDGGTRELGGRIHLIFGADVIAQLHEPGELTPFLAHEMFHVENGKYFKDCEQVWCALWAEGLATYAAKVMNPGATDKQLLLTVPKPIRPAVDANWPAALCFTRARLFSSKSEDIEALFIGGAGAREFPDRFGYYVGLRIVEELGREHRLPELSRMTPERARETLTTGIDRLIRKAGGCQ